MSAHNFWHNFKHGFMHGMFGNNPFFCCWGGFRPFFGGPFMFGAGCFSPFGWNSSIFLTPNVMTNNFYQLMPNLQMPSSNINIDFNSLFSSENVWDKLNKQREEHQNMFDKFEKTSSSQTKPASEANNEVEKDDKKEQTVVKQTNQRVNTVKNDDTSFNKMLDFVLQSEGGYVADDCGEAGNRGVRQSTYDSYRKGKGLQPRDVKELTLDETREIYYETYYKKSGADKIEDTILAFQVFDTAVNMGVGAAKELLNQSGNDADKFRELRLKRYKNIAAKNPSKRKYLEGWINRVNNLAEYVDKNLKVLA